MRSRSVCGLMIVGFLLVACTGSASQGSAGSSASSERAAPSQPKQLTIGILQEPAGWAPWGANTSAGGTLQPPILVSRTLTTIDDKGVPRAEIAAAIPALNSEDWKINPDQSMDQTWRIRADAKWQDGQPVTADDFVFGWEINTNPQLPVTVPEPKLVSAATAPDPKTLVLHFGGTTPLAKTSLFLPYPRHLLGEMYDAGTLDRFMSDPYWTTNYVGAGPYRLAEWNPGAYMRFEAFGDYLLGKPKIDTINLRFLGDQNTLMANVIGGQVDVALPDGISVEQALVLQQGWAAPGTGNNVVLYSDGRLYWIEYQEREEYAKPAAARDPRVRSALYHAIDKDGVIQVELAGLGPQADSWIHGEDPDRNAYTSAIPPWSFDVAAAARMLEDAGYRKGADGVMVSGAGERLAPELRVTQTAGHVKALSVIADGWRQAGADVTETVIPVALNSNGEYRATFPFAGVSANWVGLVWESAHFDCGSAASAANRWGSATNRSGYCNLQVQPLIDRLEVTIADADRTALRVQIMQEVLAREYSYLPLYWQVQPIVFAKGVTGPGPLIPGDFGTVPCGWNAHLWDKE